MRARFRPKKGTGDPEAAPDEEAASEADPAAAAGPAELKSPRRRALDSALADRVELRQAIAEHAGAARAQTARVNDRVAAAFAAFRLPAPSSDRFIGLAVTASGGERADGDRSRAGARPEAADPALAAVSREVKDRLDKIGGAKAKGLAVRTGSPLIDKVEGRNGTIELGKIIELLSRSGTITAGPPSAVARCQAEQQAQAILDAIDGSAVSAKKTSVSHAGGGGADLGVEELVARTVQEQMGSATAPEGRLQYGLIPNGSDNQDAQAGLLETFELRPGPSDVTSYHDFSSLQLAFADVWARVFDDELESLGREVYREYVGLKDFLGYDPAKAERPISSLDDLAWLIGEIRTLSQIAQDIVPGDGSGSQALGTNVPKGSSNLEKDAENFVNSLPGGRVGAAVATLGISELVLWFINESANFGKKPPLLWDDLVNGRTLQRGDRIIGAVENAVVPAGMVVVKLRTEFSRKKEVGLEILDRASNKFLPFATVANFGNNVDTLSDAAGQPQFYEQEKAVPTALLPSILLEFSSQEEVNLLGRYVLGDLDKIIPDRGRLTLFWKDT